MAGSVPSQTVSTRPLRSAQGQGHGVHTSRLRHLCGDGCFYLRGVGAKANPVPSHVPLPPQIA